MVNSNLLQREEYLRKKRKRKFIRILFFITFLFFIVGTVSYISHRKEVRISKVVLSGGVLVTSQEVIKETLNFLDGSYFLLFPKNNIFLYKKSHLSEHLKETFKRIDSINIKRSGFQNLVIEITERKPFAIWCKGLPEKTVEDSVEECFFMDQNSTIFAPAPNFSGDAYFKYYGTIEGDSPIGKEYIASTTQFNNISDFVLNVKGLSLKPLYVFQKSTDDFSMKMVGGGEIYFDTKESLYKVAQNLSTLLKTEDLRGLDKNNLGVEYIDLRFGNKLFYKLR